MHSIGGQNTMFTPFIEVEETSSCPRLTCPPITRKFVHCSFSMLVAAGSIVAAVLSTPEHLNTSIMFLFGSVIYGLQSYFNHNDYPSANFILQNRIRELGSDLYFSLVEEFLNVPPSAQQVIYDVAMGYFATLFVSVAENVLHSRENTASLEINSDPVFPITITTLNNPHEGIVTERLDTEIRFCCRSTRAKIITFLVLDILAAVAIVIAQFLNPLNKSSIEFVGLQVLGFTVGFLVFEKLLEKRKRVEDSMRERVIKPTSLVPELTNTCSEMFFKKLNILPVLAPFAIGPLYTFPSWSPAIIGTLMGIIYKDSRWKLRKLDLFREVPLQPETKKIFNIVKGILSSLGIAYNTRFYIRIVRMGGLDTINFAPFLPGYLIGYFGSLLSSYLFKKYGANSKIATEAFSLFTLNSYLFTGFFLWVLNEPNIGMSNTDVSPTTIVFSAIAWFCMGYGLGAEKAICDSPVLTDLLGDTIPYTSFLLFARWYVEHVLGNE